jgi:hypothetical protein
MPSPSKQEIILQVIPHLYIVYVIKGYAYKPIINNYQIFVNEKTLKSAKKYYFTKNLAK